MLDNKLTYSEGNMDEERAIIDKILSAGRPMSEWRVKVHRGVGPEYRRTFVVDDESEEGKYMCAVLNSELARWFALHASPPAYSRTMSVRDMPTPQLGADEKRAFTKIVDKILAAKSADPQTDTSKLEVEIDWLVYDLYDLTDDEEEGTALARAVAEGLKSEYADIEETKSILRERHEVRN